MNIAKKNAANDQIFCAGHRQDKLKNQRTKKLDVVEN